jgi:hypothetical protein
VIVNSALCLHFGVRHFVLQDSETGCRRVSYDSASVLLVPPNHSPRALFCHVDAAGSMLAACHSWSHPRIIRSVPAYCQAGFCPSYHPASYTEVAESRHGGQSSACLGCLYVRPGLPSPLIFQANLWHLARVLMLPADQRRFNSSGVVRGQGSHQILY